MPLNHRREGRTEEIILKIVLAPAPGASREINLVAYYTGGRTYGVDEVYQSMEDHHPELFNRIEVLKTLAKSNLSEHTIVLNIDGELAARYRTGCFTSTRAAEESDKQVRRGPIGSSFTIDGQFAPSVPTVTMNSTVQAIMAVTALCESHKFLHLELQRKIVESEKKKTDYIKQWYVFPRHRKTAPDIQEFYDETLHIPQFSGDSDGVEWMEMYERKWSNEMIKIAFMRSYFKPGSPAQEWYDSLLMRDFPLDWVRWKFQFLVTFGKNFMVRFYKMLNCKYSPLDDIWKWLNEKVELIDAALGITTKDRVKIIFIIDGLPDGPRKKLLIETANIQVLDEFKRDLMTIANTPIWTSARGKLNVKRAKIN